MMWKCKLKYHLLPQVGFGQYFFFTTTKSKLERVSQEVVPPDPKLTVHIAQLGRKLRLLLNSWAHRPLLQFLTGI